MRGLSTSRLALWISEDGISHVGELRKKELLLNEILSNYSSKQKTVWKWFTRKMHWRWFTLKMHWKLFYFKYVFVNDFTMKIHCKRFYYGNTQKMVYSENAWQMILLCICIENHFTIKMYCKSFTIKVHCNIFSIKMYWFFYKIKLCNIFHMISYINIWNYMKIYYTVLFCLKTNAFLW